MVDEQSVEENKSMSLFAAEKSKSVKLIKQRLLHPLNIELNDFTLAVKKLVPRLNSFKDEHKLNINSIEVTSEVLIIEISMNVKERGTPKEHIFK